MGSSRKVGPSTDLRALYTIYPIPRAAALWCGVPEDRVEAYLQEATALSEEGAGKYVLVHPTDEFLEHACRAIVFALHDRTLPAVVPEGLARDRQVGLEHKQILGRDLRNWIEKQFPDERPAFLFGEAEAPPVSPEAHEALQTECDALKKALAEKALPDERSRRTYQHIIAALLHYIGGEIEGVDAHPSYVSQARLIETLIEHFPRHEGLSQRTLQRKFPEARRALKSQ